MPQPISCTAYNYDGSIFAYACSYDWSRVRLSSPPPTTTNESLLLLLPFL
jgi:hypothetical protein